MELAAAISLFYAAIEDDARIGPSHISLYMALLQQWNLQGEVNPFAVKRTVIMKAAKVGSRFTYNKGLTSLHEYGYIRYSPAANVSCKSLIYLVNIKG